MPVQTFTLLNKTNRANGTITSPTITIPANVVSARWYVDSSQGGVLQYNTPTQHINFQSQVDRLDGQSFVDDRNFTSEGGYVDHQGVPTDPSVEGSYAGEGGHSLRGTIVVSGGPIRFGFFVDVTTA